jgi:hypothetical protein
MAAPIYRKSGLKPPQRLLIGLEEIGEYVGVSRWTIRRWAESSGFPIAKRPDGVYTTSARLVISGCWPTSGRDGAPPRKKCPAWRMLRYCYLGIRLDVFPCGPCPVRRCPRPEPTPARLCGRSDGFKFLHDWQGWPGAANR